MLFTFWWCFRRASRATIKAKLVFEVLLVSKDLGFFFHPFVEKPKIIIFCPRFSGAIVWKGVARFSFVFPVFVHCV